MVSVSTEHIEITPGVCVGKPRIAGHRIKVQHVAIWHEQMGMSPDEIVSQYPGISLADVYAALAYYYDHREQIEADIKEGEEFVAEMRAKAPRSRLQQILAERDAQHDPVSLDKPQAFWDAYRKRWRAKLFPWDKNCENTGPWTKLIIQAAKEACEDFARELGREVRIGSEGHGRIDVHAEDVRSHELLVAFESELASWGYNGASGKDWREEFPKLCRKRALLRVLSSTFRPGTGRDFPKFLRERLDSMRAYFDEGHPEDFCLVFGPDDTRKDPDQPWLAFSLERDFTLRPLASSRPFIPRRVIDEKESPKE